MIYLVSNTLSANGMDDVRMMSVEDSIRLIRSWPVVQFDTETTGLDPRICHLLSMQFGYKYFKTGEHTEIVVDCKSIKPEEYKEAIESSHLIGHNLKFDLKFLYNHSIIPLKVYDTMICEQTLYLGYKPGKVSFKLDDVLRRHTGEELDKSMQKVIAHTGLTQKGIRYAAYDVVPLQDIRKSQMTIAEARNCIKAFLVENRFVPAIAYLEWCGVHLDEKKWRVKMKKDEKTMQDYLDKLNDYVVSSTKLSEFVSTTATAQPDSVAGLSLFDFPPQCIVDWNSPQQVYPVFDKLGFNTTVTDKETGTTKHSVEEGVIQYQRGIADDFLDTYLGYKGAYKNVSSYGIGHINQINPYTNRIHTEFRQIGTTTGRMASGSKKTNKDLAKAKKISPDLVTYCNMQNLPARGEEGKYARSCFTATEGNVFVSCDYSAEESRVSADVWDEKSLLDAFKNGIDTHNLYAKMCFPEELKDIDVKDVKAKRPDLRQAAKSAEFAVSYGSNGSSIATAIGMPVEKAKDMVQGILKGMPGMTSYKKKTTEFLKKNGYIVINPVTGHRIYWPEWAQWRSVEDRLDRSFWEMWPLHKGTGDSTDKMMQKHKAQEHEWFDKNVLNYPIQGGSAIVLKQAAADLFKWVVEHGYFNKILFCVFVHDEIDCECPEELREEFSKQLSSIMEKAAAKFYKRLPVPAESSVGQCWIH